MVAFAESQVGVTTDQIISIADIHIHSNNLRGGIFERNRKCLEALANFQKPSKSAWEAILAIRDIRNCIVHANSRIWDSNNEKRIRSYVNSLPGLSATQDILELSPEFPIYAINEINGFIMSLYGEAAELCKRVEFWKPSS